MFMKTKEREKVLPQNAWKILGWLRRPDPATPGCGLHPDSWLLNAPLAGISREVDENKGTRKNKRAQYQDKASRRLQVQPLRRTRGFMILTPGSGLPASNIKVHPAISMKTKGKDNMSYTRADGSAQSGGEDSDSQLLTPEYWLLNPNSSLPFPKMKVHPAIFMKKKERGRDWRQMLGKMTVGARGPKSVGLPKGA